MSAWSDLETDPPPYGGGYEAAKINLERWNKTAPGAYTVWAQSERGGYVRRTVVVQAAVMTTLNLEGGAAKEKSLAME